MEKIKFKDFYNIKSNPTRKRKLNEEDEVVGVLKAAEKVRDKMRRDEIKEIIKLIFTLDHGRLVKVKGIAQTQYDEKY